MGISETVVHVTTFSYHAVRFVVKQLAKNLVSKIVFRF